MGYKELLENMEEEEFDKTFKPMPRKEFGIPEKGIYHIVQAGWDHPNKIIEMFIDEFEKLGIYVYDLPSSKNSGDYGYIFSKEELSEEQIEKIELAEFG